MVLKLHVEGIIRNLFPYTVDVLQTVRFAGATEVTFCGIVSTLLSEWSHLKITNKCVLPTRHVIVAELHETGCSSGCLFVLFQAAFSLSSPLCASAQQDDMKGRWRVFWSACVRAGGRAGGLGVCVFVCLPGNSKTGQGWDKQKC